MSKLYVIGHVNPDTDSIAAAMSYAWLLAERDGEEVIAARAGALNPQTSWVLKRLELPAPELLTDASPRFESVTRRFDTTTPDKPLRDAWAISSRTGSVAPVVNEDGTPYGLITGWSLFSFLGETVGPHPNQQQRSIADILETACSEATDTDVPAFKSNSRIRDALNRILRSEKNDFFVVDEDGAYVGVCRQRDLLSPPRLRFILVDHNEARQSIGSLHEAELVEILDHHRLDNPSTHVPIRMTVDIVGSTCTLVSERTADAGLSAPPQIAGLMLAGLLSDTLTLTSPTTTKRDHDAAETLARWAFVANGPLAGETVESFGQQVIEAGAGLDARDPVEIVNSDLKLYETSGLRFSVSQAEVTKFVQLENNQEPLEDALDHLRESQGLDFSMLMVTDVVRGSSRLLIANAPPDLNDLPYQLLPNGMRRAQGVVSRKKQLLPVILGLLED
ncbi:MAG: CBS domain-containing protein [Chloroflexi bacterium]|nr:MAG: CBS domain-containing protein [Chloroflexota bacterium]MBL1195937.1 CBS domain-containing protein [Chloroflexota bacterium]NOH13230.1 CBS domain-containing protein [Chloroflexota bacterium]